MLRNDVHGSLGLPQFSAVNVAAFADIALLRVQKPVALDCKCVI